MKLSLFWTWIALLSLAGSILAPPVQANVTLTDFHAEARTATITVYWETAGETGNLGFRLWRSLDEMGDYTDASGFIASLDEGAGALYEYEDVNVTPGVIYYYKLKDTPGNGSIGVFTDPISATIPLTTTYVFLPTVYHGWSPLPLECDRPLPSERKWARFNCVESEWNLITQ